MTPNEQLTAREEEVWPLIADQLTDEEIAERLFISIHTVKKHVASILAKLGVTHRQEAGRYYRRKMGRGE